MYSDIGRPSYSTAILRSAPSCANASTGPKPKPTMRTTSRARMSGRGICRIGKPPLRLSVVSVSAMVVMPIVLQMRYSASIDFKRPITDHSTVRTPSSNKHPSVRPGTLSLDNSTSPLSWRIFRLSRCESLSPSHHSGEM